MTAPVSNTSSRVAAALAALDAVGGRLRQLRIDHAAADNKIKTAVSADRNLTAEGKQAALRERRAKLAKSGMATIAQLRSDVDTALQTIASRVEAHLPKARPGLEALLVRQAAWSRSRGLLEAGAVKPLALIAETSDTEVLHALIEELPTWVRARGGNAEQVSLNLELRLAKVKGAQPEADLLAKHEAVAIAAGLHPMLDYAEGEVAGRVRARSGDGMAAAFAARRAQQDTQRHFNQALTGAGGDDQ